MIAFGAFVVAVFVLGIIFGEVIYKNTPDHGGQVFVFTLCLTFVVSYFAYPA